MPLAAVATGSSGEIAPTLPSASVLLCSSCSADNSPSLDCRSGPLPFCLARRRAAPPRMTARSSTNRGSGNHEIDKPKFPRRHHLPKNMHCRLTPDSMLHTQIVDGPDQATGTIAVIAPASSAHASPKYSSKRSSTRTALLVSPARIRAVLRVNPGGNTNACRLRWKLVRSADHPSVPTWVFLDMLMTLQGVYERLLGRLPQSLRRAPRWTRFGQWAS
jgi:hypothetical protein